VHLPFPRLCRTCVAEKEEATWQEEDEEEVDSSGVGESTDVE